MPQSTVPYIGSKISLISNSEIRYEGILYTINTQESTIALQSVRCFGTEGRKMPEIPPSSEVYDFIIFRGQDIKDLTVLEACNAVSDPAIVSINQRPAGGKGAQTAGSGSIGTGGGKAPAKSSASTRSAGGGNAAISNIFSWSNQSAAPAAKSGGRGKGDDYGTSSGGWGSSGRGRDDYSAGWDASSWASGGWSASSWGGGKDYGWSSNASYAKGSGGGQKGWGSEVSKGKAQKGGKTDPSKGKAKGTGKAPAKGDTGKGSGTGKSSGRRGGSGSAGNSGVPVGELVPEDNAEAKKEFAEEFDYGASNDKFDKVTTSEDVDGLEDRLKPLAGYDKGKSFFDNISCEATERATDNDRLKVDRDKARQFDRETFGDTRRPPRPTGGRPGKGTRRGGTQRSFRS